MPRYRLFAPLTNAVGQFPLVALGEPFSIERWTRSRIVRLWRNCTDLPRYEVEVQADSSQCLPDEAKYGHVAVADIESTGTSDEQGWRQTHAKSDAANAELKSRFRMVSLYLNADVEPIVYFWYSDEGGSIEFESGLGIGEPKDRRPGYVDRHNVQRLNDFLSRTRLPLDPPYVHLALEHWEQSQRGASRQFELLSLVTALEALFNAGGQDIRYRVARSVAVLVGRTAEHSDEIFEATSKAYEVRSRLVHTGTAKGIETIWLHGLRTTVRDAVLKCYMLGLPKQDLAAATDTPRFWLWRRSYA